MGGGKGVGRAVNIIGITGRAGSGKSHVANTLVTNHGFVAVSLADPMKRAIKEWFGFTDEQLWGPSELRNAPDKRFPRKHEWIAKGWSLHVCACCGFNDEHKNEPLPQCFLTPRFALQRCGTEFGRVMFEDVWINKALVDAKALLVGGEKYRRHSYVADRGLIDRGEGIGPEEILGVVIPDVRFENELTAIRAVGGRIWLRPGKGNLSPSAAAHASETSLDEDIACDARILWQAELSMLDRVVAMLLESQK